MSTDPVLDPVTLQELRRLARSRPRSGRQAAAKASAIRTLERLAREGRRQPIPPMPEGWYPHEPDDPFYELDWQFLHEHPHILQRHWQHFAAAGGAERRECVEWSLQVSDYREWLNGKGNPAAAVLTALRPSRDIRPRSSKSGGIP